MNSIRYGIISKILNNKKTYKNLIILIFKYYFFIFPSNYDFIAQPKILLSRLCCEMNILFQCFISNVVKFPVYLCILKYTSICKTSSGLTLVSVCLMASGNLVDWRPDGVGRYIK